MKNIAIRLFTCRSLLFSLFALLWAPTSFALSTQITVSDLVKFLNDYRYSADTHKQSIAVDMQQRFANAGITFTDNGFLISGNVPTVSGDLLSCNELAATPIIGSPGIGPLSGDTSGSYSVFLDGNATKFNFGVANRNIDLGIAIGGNLSGNASANLHWY